MPGQTPEAPKQAPTASDVMAGMMPDAEQLQNKPKVGAEVRKEDIDKASKGYPKANPSQYSDAFSECKAIAASNLRPGETWHPGSVANHIDWHYVDKDKKMHGNEFILVTGNKKDEYHFFRNSKEETPREPNAAEKKQIKEQQTKNKKEAEEAQRAEIDKEAEELVKNNIKDPVTEVTPDSNGTQAQKVAAQAAKKLKSEGDWSKQDGAENTRVIAVWVSSGKHYYYGKRKG